jgi:hypothetical protein
MIIPYVIGVVTVLCVGSSLFDRRRRRRLAARAEAGTLSTRELDDATTSHDTVRAVHIEQRVDAERSGFPPLTGSR